jgi:hypothetical protein
MIALELTSCNPKGSKTPKPLRATIDSKLPSEHYTGLIHYYDTTTNSLIRETNYFNGLPDGDETLYYTNGKVKVKGHYNDGRKNGIALFYDSLGSLVSQQYFFYGIVCGQSVKYRHNEPSQYWFYSLDNNELFFIDYDSVKSQRIESLQKGFIYFNLYQKAQNIFLENPQREYLLYLINPPKFRFTYSLCRVDSNLKFIRDVLKFNSNEPWVKFQIFENDRNNYAIRLLIDDDINKRSVEMLKHL